MVIHNVFHHTTILWLLWIMVDLSIIRTILRSNIYAKILFLRVLSTAFKKLLSNKHLQEPALIFTTSSKSHEEMECDGMKKEIVYYFWWWHRPFPKFQTQRTAYSEIDYRKIHHQTRNTISKRINFKVPWFSNIFPDNAVEGGKQPPWAVKPSKFILVQLV